MKKKELEKLDKLNEKLKLTPEVKHVILKKVLNNFLIALGILLLFIGLIIISRTLKKDTTLLIYKVCSILLFTITLFIFEWAYKKDNDNLCVYGIEMLILSIATLLTPYIFLERPNTFTLIVGDYFTVYYILKNLVVYKKEKNKYVKEQNDIKQIIKKESQDKLAQKEKKQETIQKEKKQETIQKEKQETIEEPVKKKRGRPKKVATK